MGGKLTVVHALRGLAALWVVMFHASTAQSFPLLNEAIPEWSRWALFDWGRFGVAVFFALSGFVIAHSLVGVEMTGAGLGRFMLRRSVRLDPAYWASIAFVLIAGWTIAILQNRTIVLPSAGEIGSHMFYLQELLRFRELNLVYWTLTYEIQFYAFYALTLMLPHRMWGLFALAIASALGVFDDLLPGLFLDLWGAFFVGVLARHAVDDARLTIGVAALALALGWGSEFGLVSGLTAIVLWASCRSGWAERGLNWRWLQFLGTTSYSLYLVHLPIVVPAAFVAHKIAGHSLAGDVFTLAFVLASSVFAAALLWWTVERPSHRLSRRISLTEELQPWALIGRAQPAPALERRPQSHESSPE